MSDIYQKNLQDLNREINFVSDEMSENLKKIEKRGMDLENLRRGSVFLEKNLDRFKKNTKKIKEKEKKKYFCLKNIIKISVLIFALISDLFCFYKIFKEDGVFSKVILSLMCVILTSLFIGCLIDLIENFDEIHIINTKISDIFLPTQENNSQKKIIE